MVAGCFEPRHGIKIVNKTKVTDLVICFQCYSVLIYSGKQSGEFLIEGSPKVFNQIADNLKLERNKR